MRRFGWLAALLLVAGCGGGDSAEAPAINSLADMVGRKMGYLSGSAFKDTTEKVQPGIIYAPYNDYNSTILALKSGKVDGVPVDEPYARYWVAHNPGVLKLVTVYTQESYSFVFKKGSPLRDEFTGVIRRLQVNGTLDRLRSKWCDSDSLDIPLETLPEEPGHTGSRGTLNVTTSPEIEPMEFIQGGQIVGLEIDIINRIAWELDFKTRFTTTSFGALIESVTSGKADLACSTVVNTEERRKSIDFSDPHYLNGGIALLARDERGGSGGTWNIAASFRRTFVDEMRWREILAGLGRTLAITLLAVIFGSVLAFPVWRLRISKIRAMRVLGKAYVAIMQGTPTLVLLMILYYLVFGQCEIDGLFVAVIGFALNLAAYVGEMLRTGVAAVPVGQSEAAAALGFGRFESFCRVVMPQALKHILPVYRGEVIGLLKATSIVGYISVVDLTKVSDLIRARTYEAFFPLISTALVYLLFAWLITVILGGIERRLGPARQ